VDFDFADVALLSGALSDEDFFALLDATDVFLVPVSRLLLVSAVLLLDPDFDLALLDAVSLAEEDDFPEEPAFFVAGLLFSEVDFFSSVVLFAEGGFDDLRTGRAASSLDAALATPVTSNWSSIAHANCRVLLTAYNFNSHDLPVQIQAVGTAISLRF
jgi:hypothetical protein